MRYLFILCTAALLQATASEFHKKQVGLLEVLKGDFLEEEKTEDNNPHIPYVSCVYPKNDEEIEQNKISDAMVRIIDGHETFPGETPWLISLQDVSFTPNLHMCGGAILTERYVLTAAHCVQDFKNNFQSLEVVAGEWDLTSSDGFEQRQKLNQINIHPDYDPLTKHKNAAILRLAEDIHFNFRVSTIEVAVDDEDIDESSCVMSGWGPISTNGPVNDKIMKKSLPLIDSSICADFYGLMFDKSMFCAGGQGSCMFDTGGPLVCDVYAKNSKSESIRAVGISSFGIGCDVPTAPGVYTSIPLIEDWIEDIIE